MSNYRKVIYWDKSYRIVRAEQVPAIEEAIQGKRPFRLHHAHGIDLVQPGAISLITEPKYDEIPPEPKPLAQLQEGKPEERSPLPSEIMALLRIAMWCSSDKRKEVLADFKRASEKWRSSGIIEIPDKYSKGERNE